MHMVLDEAFVLEAPAPQRVVVFAAGAGGNPVRHAGLLESLAERGCTVLAPHAERMMGAEPDKEKLHARERALRACLGHAAALGLPVAAVGHSIGAALLLGLAGGQMWMRGGERLGIGADERIRKLVLMTPAMDFFRAPGALDAVRTPVQVWAGLADVMTPPAQVEFLEKALCSRTGLDVRYVAGAGHFSFMNELPPGVTDPLPDRTAFLDHLAAEVGAFVARQD